MADPPTLSETATVDRPLLGGPRLWLLAAVLMVPAFAPLVGHYIGFWRDGLVPTGFVIYDTPYYLANAREHFDAGHFTWAYSNPFSFDYASPRIYFQPLTLVLGILMRVTSADPGVIFAIVGLVTALVCARIAIALFDEFGDRSAPGGLMTLIAFCWGGGIFVLTGTLFAALVGSPDAPRSGFDTTMWWWFVREADPARGWWFLNLGRNLVLPTEALYHAIFFAAVVLIVQRRFNLAVAAMALLSISHPFTGVQLLAIVTAWAGLETIVLRNRTVPRSFFAASVLLMLGHAAYYLVFLPNFPEHRQLQAQWALRWTLTLPQSIFAYGIVAILAFMRLRTPSRFKEAMQSWPNRLLMIWLLVSLALENHELFLPKAIQPLHFTRGYSWVALFLLGVPTLASLLRKLRESPAPLVRWAVPAFVLTLLFADNAVWLGATTTEALKMPLGREIPADSMGLGYGLKPDKRAVLDWMRDKAPRSTVLLSEDYDIGYLATVYTPLRSWRSHYANTPWNLDRRDELAAFFASGTVVERWRSLPLLLVFNRSSPWRQRTAAIGGPSELLYENDSYIVVRAGAVGPSGEARTVPPGDARARGAN